MGAIAFCSKNSIVRISSLYSYTKLIFNIHIPFVHNKMNCSGGVYRNAILLLCIYACAFSDLKNPFIFCFFGDKKKSFNFQTHLPHFVIIISVPIWWNSDHRSEFCNFTSAPGSWKRGGIGGSWRVGKIDEYGSVKRWFMLLIIHWLIYLLNTYEKLSNMHF